MNPYSELPDRAFWKKAVASKSLFDISGLWEPKFDIKPHHKVATFGSCFAQHIGNALKSRDFNWLITEPAPEGLSPANSKKFNYGVFTARTGNIYTASLLRQWTEWALGQKAVPDEVWEDGGRFFDPFRPVVEPDGFASIAELRSSQRETIKAFRESIIKSDYFVFTLGLTESWFNTSSGYEYPMCPGTAAGKYVAGEHEFKNQQFNEIAKNLNAAIKLMRTANPKLKFILTVSPVPLTATKSGRHVLVATMDSKSILRAVAGQVANSKKHVDYFPSYEIINSPTSKGIFFEPNQRSVHPKGVEFVMEHFFTCLEARFGKPNANRDTSAAAQSARAYEVACEEELLNAFG